MTGTTAAQPQAIGEYIDISRLEPSPTNPRKKFYEASLGELAASIRGKGVLEPLIVRRKPEGESFEIVCGERRYRASTIAELVQVPCIVRDLDDSEVLDIQIHENLHREDVHPMDEAFGYQKLKDHLKCDNAELALRVGKSEKFVAQRLKLNDLIEDAQKDIEDGHLPLAYALEIAKFAPDVQKIILGEAYQKDSKWISGKMVYSPIKTQLASWASFIQFIREKVLVLLSAAPFSTKATNLRPDGLACVACPQRTGANAGLFEPDEVDKKDSCLNPTCFTGKKQQHLVQIRQRLANEASVMENEVPLVNLSSYWESDGVPGYTNFTLIGKKPFKSYGGQVSDKSCDKAVTAVNIDTGQFAKPYTICQRKACKVHGSSSSSSSGGTSVAEMSPKEREADLRKKRERREELFDIAVGEIVRRRVFRQATEKFAKAFDTVGALDGFLPLVIAKMWTNTSGNDGTTQEKIVIPILSEILGEKKSNLSFGYEQREVAKKIAELSQTTQNHLLFLLANGNTGAMYWESYTSQTPVRELAHQYEVDHRLIDAEARLQVAEEKAKKHLPAFKLYLDAVRSGDEKAKIPRPYAETYRPKD